MTNRLSIFHPPGRLTLPGQMFGKDVANLQLYRALAQHGGFEQLDLLSFRPGTDQEAAEDLLAGASTATRLTAGPILDQARPAAAGALLRGRPDLYDLTWLRRRAVGDRAYSLLGLVHTLAPPATRQTIAMSLVGPLQPWDAIICTSPSVHEALARMLAEWSDHLGERTGGGPPPQPALPIVPLGVDGPHFAALADRPQVRERLRGELGLAEADVLILWVGRLSYFEKAFPQPMFQAVRQAADAAGGKVHFALAGWFPAETDRNLYRQAAQAYAPDLPVHFIDGADRERLRELWAAADIFLSLVDNIQETFGITPLEAMAAGLPVVASDWDGYRFTMRHGVEGFLIPTLGGPAGGLGVSMVARHTMLMDSYQAYVGAVAQHTAVHVGRCAEALAELIRSPDLRRRMGAAGRERVRTTFDWPLIARQMGAVIDDLARIRLAAPEAPPRHRADPVKGDPFRDFAGFASQTLSLELALSVPAGVTPEDVRRTQSVALAAGFSQWRATVEECVRAFELIAAGEAGTVREVLLAFPTPRRRAMEMGLMWMAKHGLVDWLAQP